MIANYVDFLPKIPDRLLAEVDRIITTKDDELEKFTGGKHWAYQFYPIDGDLSIWLLENVIQEKTDCFHIHVITTKLMIHKDYNSKKFKMNYIFQTGGENVKTNFYDDRRCLLESHSFEQHRWHHFNGQYFHGVDGIDIGKRRIAITLGTDRDFNRLAF